ncbi:Na+/H+ antiporter [Paenibacillus nasutitermitis]|uniref:Sodium, potassium, lithium and rubidium/H(+) antiporter n=1 Tax=Paenibacillus nasutitermitis TaxID=1652958 RepID=A0A916Z727_9BACL|nr:Na+/H+ antiporter [Paenibacillus nasutitermitis]GGD77573.1 sodium, potassium, lithium and rubidium/H(+) antiporter [Paenibacillus nasutitermitis]
MELFYAVLVLLGLIAVSHVLNRRVPSVPVPLIQIALGIAVSAIPSGIHMPLEPELFFLLFIAPLLYNDGKHTPRSELWRLRAPILLLAVGLVFVTVFVIGYAIHWMIPAIPLPVAFGLAAILSPTDAVAVGALAGRIHLPKSLMHLLEGEALMNDASGLVAFKFAVAAAVTGVFSLPKASVSFLVIAIGGVVVGVIVASVITGIRYLLRQSGLEDETMHMLIHILTPFALYLAAEELGVSGILAAVAGGVMHAVERDRSNRIRPRPHEVSDNTWSVILFLLNGLVFVILGLQIPDVFSTILKSPLYNNFEAFGYAAVIFILLIVLRFLWSYAFSAGGRLFGVNKREDKLSFKILAMTSLSGVRGAVTLAGAFSIPLFIDNGDPFPERSLVIFLAAVVILLSLLAASILLPLLAKQDDGNNKEEWAEKKREGELAMMCAAIQAVHYATNVDNEPESASVLADYSRWMRQIRLPEDHRPLDRRFSRIEAELRLEALGIERAETERLLAEGEISEEHGALFLRSLEKLELLVSQRRQLLFVILRKWTRGLKVLLAKNKPKQPLKLSEADREALRQIKRRTSSAVTAAFESRLSGSDRNKRMDIIRHYRYLGDHLSKLDAARTKDVREINREVRLELHWIALQAERDEVQSLYERGDITRDMANELRRVVRDREASLLEQE